MSPPLRRNRRKQDARRLFVERLEPRLLLATTSTSAGLLAESDSIWNLPVAADAREQRYPGLAVNPNDSRHLVMTFTDGGTIRGRGVGDDTLGVAVSRDGGETWQQRELALPDQLFHAFLPAIAFDDAGKVFATVTYGHEEVFENVFPFRTGVLFWRSDDGGDTWSGAIEVAGTATLADHADAYALIGHPYLAVDTFSTLPDGRPNPYYGQIYITYTNEYLEGHVPGNAASVGGIEKMMAVSADGGLTWNVPRQQREVWLDHNHDGRRQPDEVATAEFSVLSDPLNFPLGLSQIGIGGGMIAVGPEGDVYVSDVGGGSFVLYHSTDGGRTFTAPDRSRGVQAPFNFQDAGFDPILRDNGPFAVPVRSIAADPTRPGTVYVTTGTVLNFAFDVDRANIYFARSEDYGQTWEYSDGRAVFDRSTPTLNDDNGGRVADPFSSDEITAGQLVPFVAVDEQSRVIVAWYDARRGDVDRRFDVFAAISTDGGRTFGPNFRLTDVTFDTASTPSIFHDPPIHAALIDGVAYVAWTDLRAENADVYFARFPLDQAPLPGNDRFEENDGPATAIELGPLVTKQLPRLRLTPDDEDWFRLAAVTSGTLQVTAELLAAGALRVDIYDATTLQPLATSHGPEQRRLVQAPIDTRKQYLVRVSGASDRLDYRLELESATENLDTRVVARVAGELQEREAKGYLLRAAASGHIRAELRATSGAVQLQVRDPASLAILTEVTAEPDSLASLTLPVVAGEPLLVSVIAADVETAFQLEWTNLTTLAQPSVTQRVPLPASSLGQSVQAEDLNGDGWLDLVSRGQGEDLITVYVSNGGGSFQAPRQYPLGASGRRGNGLFQLDDFSGDGIVDIAAVNAESADVSVLLGRGDGTFETQRRVDAVPHPLGIRAGDFNGDGHRDLWVVEEVGLKDTGNSPASAVLLGRGDGTFLPARIQPIAGPAAMMQVADMNGDLLDDLVWYTAGTNRVHVSLSNGDGTFQSPRLSDPLFLFFLAEFQDASQRLITRDLNGDSHLDVMIIGFNRKVVILDGRGDGTFGAAKFIPTSPGIFSGMTPQAVFQQGQLTDYGSPRFDEQGNLQLGPPDGVLDLVLSQRDFSFTREQTVVIFGVFAAHQDGRFEHFLGELVEAQPFILDSTVEEQRSTPALTIQQMPGSALVAVADLDQDRLPDLVHTRHRGTPALDLVFYEAPSLRHDTPATARQLGPVTQVVEPIQSLAADDHETWYRFQVPREAATSNRSIVDVAGGFAYEEGAGLGMQLYDASGRLLAEGAQVRFAAEQEQEFLVRVHRLPDAEGELGAGAFRLAIVTLPQVVKVEPLALLPGTGNGFAGAVTSLVITFQGERLDRESAESVENYQVLYLGADGLAGTADDRILPVGGGEIARPVIYNDSANVDVSSGQTFATAVRQTITLLFADPLPTGSYEIQLAPAIRAATFDTPDGNGSIPAMDEMAPALVSLVNDEIHTGARIHGTDLVPASQGELDLQLFESGTRFLTQLQNDLSTLLDEVLTELGDDISITDLILDHILDRVAPGLTGAFTDPLTSIDSALILFLDPVSFDLVAPDGSRAAYDLQQNRVARSLAGTFVEVGGNVEIVVIPNAAGLYRLDVADVPARARGGVVYVSAGQRETIPITAALRRGDSQFSFSFDPSRLNPSRVDSASRLAIGVLPTITQLLTLPSPVPAVTRILAVVSSSTSTIVTDTRDYQRPAQEQVRFSTTGVAEGRIQPGTISTWEDSLLSDAWKRLRRYVAPLIEVDEDQPRGYWRSLLRAVRGWLDAGTTPREGTESSPSPARIPRPDDAGHRNPSSPGLKQAGAARRGEKEPVDSNRVEHHPEAQVEEAQSALSDSPRTATGKAVTGTAAVQHPNPGNPWP